MGETSLKMKPEIRMPIRAIGLLAVLLLPLWWEGAVPATAQSDTVIWSRPANLSNTSQSSGHPAIVADGHGYVHVLWSEEVGGEAMQPQDLVRTGNSIFYTRWDGASWTQPIDILFVPGEAIAEFVAVDVDAENRLHAVWTGQSNFYYSNAPSWQAESAHAWSKPVVVATNSARSQLESDIAADASANLHLVYATRGDGAGIYYIRSHDGGATWELATRLSEPFGPLETSFASVRVITDDAGRLHVVWQTTQEQGYGQAVYYARSIDGGKNWSAPVQLGYRDPEDYEASWPYLTAIGESELYLIYIDGSSKGRCHRISIDGGETWSEPRRVITEMEGVNGHVIPVVDGSGQVHLIVNMRTRAGQVVGIYYARWLGSGWSPIVPVDVSSPAAPSAHHTAAVVRLGNELHVVYNQLRTGEIWHLRGVLPAVTPAPMSALPTLRPPPPLPTPTMATATPPPAPPSGQPPIDLAASSFATSPVSNALLPGIGMALFLVVSVVVWTRVRPR